MLAKKRGFTVGVLLIELGSAAVYMIKPASPEHVTFKVAKRTLGLTSAFSTDMPCDEAI